MTELSESERTERRVLASKLNRLTPEILVENVIALLASYQSEGMGINVMGGNENRQYELDGKVEALYELFDALGGDSGRLSYSYL